MNPRNNSDHYQHILAAIDVSGKSRAVARRAAALCRLSDARLSLLRVLEHLPVNLPVDPVPPEGVDKIEWLSEHALGELREFAHSEAISRADVAVSLGSPKQEITDFARENGVDLIVVGAHERHGLDLLRGSTTTDGIVQQAPCDVLAVHVD